MLDQAAHDASPELAVEPHPSVPIGSDVIIAAGIPLLALSVLLFGTYFISSSESRATGTTSPSLAFIVAALLVQNLFILFWVYVAARRKGRRIFQVIGLVPLSWKRTGLALIAGLLVGPIMSFVVQVLQAALGYAQRTPGVDILAPEGFSWPAFAVMLAAGGVLAPITEEVLFRGIVFGWLRRKVSPWIAAIGSAIPFGAAHLEQNPGDAVAHVAYAFCVGIALALIYQRLGSLWASITTHVAINVTAIGYVYLALYYGMPLDQL
jgi:uncharacterized protein